MRKRLSSWISPQKETTNKRQNQQKAASSHEPNLSAQESETIVIPMSRPILSNSKSRTSLSPINVINSDSLSIENITMEAEKFAQFFSQALSTPHVQQGLRVAIKPLTDQIEAKIGVINQRLDNVEVSIDEHDLKMSIMEQKMDDIDQQLKKDNIRIYGLKDEKEEDLPNKLVAFFKEAIRINCDQYDINNTYRLGNYRAGHTREVIVKFSSNLIKAKVMKHRRNLKDIQDKIYVNDDLTKYRALLYKQVRDNIQRKRLHSAWTTDGTINAKLHETSKPVRINSQQQLNDLTTL